MTDKQLRARLLEHALNVLIMRGGWVHAYGIMPNTNKLGWYYMGHKDDLKREYEYEAQS